MVKKSASIGRSKKTSSSASLLKSTEQKDGISSLMKSDQELLLHGEMENNVEKDGTITSIPKWGRANGIRTRSSSSLKHTRYMVTNGLRSPSIYQAVLTMLSRTTFTQRSVLWLAESKNLRFLLKFSRMSRCVNKRNTSSNTWKIWLSTRKTPTFKEIDRWPKTTCSNMSLLPLMFTLSACWEIAASIWTWFRSILKN